MSVFFDAFEAAANGSIPPTAVRLRAKLRSQAGVVPIILEYRLDEDHNVWFQDAPGNPGRMKRITYNGSVGPDQVEHETVAPLVYGGPRPPGVQIRAALTRHGAGLDRAIDEIQIG